ncbi:MAG: SurA N-terminal domain-containing protein [Pseudomonadales bacterium]|jgi:peptidyl-prolyl cis-trans isomerase D
MLQQLRDQTHSLFFKVLVGAIIFVLAIFGFGAFNLFLTRDPAVASVNGEDITTSRVTVEAERERRRLAAQLGESFDPDTIDPVMLQNSVINQLINRMLLAQAADDLGIGASDKQVNRTVLANPNFQIDGQFEENAYRRVVSMLGYTPSEFLNLTRELIGIEQLRSGIVETAFIPQWELRENARILSQRRDLAYLTFDPESYAEKSEVSDDDVKLRYEENQLDYMTDETVDVAYVELTADSLMNDPSIEVTEEDIAATYEAEKAEAGNEEQRDSRHILLTINDQRTAQQAIEQIRALKARIEAGESFAELAKEYSEDPGSAAKGGDLGPVSKGLFAPEFEKALWNLDVGELSDPVQTEFGVHLIQLKGIVANEFPPLEEMHDQIETRLRRDAATRLFSDRLRELDNLAFEQPDSLEGISGEMNLPIQTASGISRTEGTGIFGNVDLRDAVFADEVLEEGYNSAAVEYVKNRAVVARVTARHEPKTIPLDEVADDIRAQIAHERAMVAIEADHRAAEERLEAGENVSAIADDYGLVWQTYELIRRNQPGVPQEVLGAAFGLPRPGEGKSVGSAQGADGTRYLITVTRVQDGDLATMSESEIDSMRRFLVERASRLDFESFYQALEDDASIDRPAR